MTRKTKLDMAAIEKSAKAIARIHPVIEHWCYQIYGKKKFALFRKEYFAGKFNDIIPAKDRAIMEELQAIEVDLLELHKAMLHKHALFFYRRSLKQSYCAEYDDFLQEARIALVNCVYFWDGRTKFSTFAYRAIRNNLANYYRKLPSISVPAPPVLQKKRRIQNYMEEHQCTFEEAADYYEFSPEEVALIRQTFVTVVSHSSEFKIGNSQNECLFSELLEDTREKGLPEGYDPSMMEVFKECPLSDIEKEAVMAYLSGERFYPVRISKERGVTRSAVGAAVKRALNRFQALYLDKFGKKDAA